MLINLKEVIKKYNLNIKGVIQIGSHWAEEHDVYTELGIRYIVYVEACKDAYEKMGAILLQKSNWLKGAVNPLYNLIELGDIKMFNVACGDEECEMEMHVSHDNQGQSNSLLKPQLHIQQHPEVRFTDKEKVKVMPLDNLPFDREKYNLLMMDVQGAEGLVLKGAKETLQYIDVIYTEVNRGQTYAGNMEIDEMDVLLFGHGFLRKETYWPSANWTWGDAVYIRDTKWFTNEKVVQ